MNILPGLQGSGTCSETTEPEIVSPVCPYRRFSDYLNLKILAKWLDLAYTYNDPASDIYHVLQISFQLTKNILLVHHSP